jgi:hypothetical protein
MSRPAWQRMIYHRLPPQPASAHVLPPEAVGYRLSAELLNCSPQQCKANAQVINGNKNMTNDIVYYNPISFNMAVGEKTAAKY